MRGSLQTKRDRELQDRVTAPQHVAFHHFGEHKAVEGYLEFRDQPDFQSSDLLLRLDTMFGTIQLGYHPGHGQSFLFANIKTSRFDTVASRYQKELRDYQMMQERKAGTQNLTFLSRRQESSAVILYKRENKPWSAESVAPYLRRMNMGVLRKTMPFLDRRQEQADYLETLREKKELERELRAKTAAQDHAGQVAVRARDTALIARQNELMGLLPRMCTQERHFFRKLNYAFDIQKQEMFTYYQERRAGGIRARAETAPAEPGEKDDEEE